MQASTPDKTLTEYGLRYHRECEAYDQQVCARKNRRGIAIPEGNEYSLVNRNAKLVRRRLANELIAANLASPDNAIDKMQKAISMANYAFDREWDREHNL